MEIIKGWVSRPLMEIPGNLWANTMGLHGGFPAHFAAWSYHYWYVCIYGWNLVKLNLNFG